MREDAEGGAGGAVVQEERDETDGGTREGGVDQQRVRRDALHGVGAVVRVPGSGQRARTELEDQERGDERGEGEVLVSLAHLTPSHGARRSRAASSTFAGPVVGGRSDTAARAPSARAMSRRPLPAARTHYVSKESTSHFCGPRGRRSVGHRMHSPTTAEESGGACSSCRTDPRAVKGVALRVRARDIVREKEATVTRRRHGLRARPRARLLASALGRARDATPRRATVSPARGRLTWSVGHLLTRRRRDAGR